MFKKTSIAAAVVLCVIATAGNSFDSQEAMASDSPIRFSDTQGHWAEGAIQSAVSSGVVDGYPDGTFKPDADISRAEFIKLVAMATGTKASAVEGGNWYQSYVDDLKKRNLLRDDEFTDFNVPMNRLEMAKVALREVRDDVRDPNAIMSDEAYIFTSVKSGLIQGLAKGELGINEKTTRAQSMTVIERMKALKKGEKLEVDKQALNTAELSLTGTNMKSVMGAELAIQFPYDASWEEGIKFTLHRLIIIDCDNPNDPNLGLLQGLRRQDGKPFSNCYVFAYDTSLEVLTKGEGAGRVYDYFHMNTWINATGESVLHAFYRTKVGKTNGYLFFVTPDKESTDNNISQNKARFRMISGSKSIVINK
ncbi:S-layer homology domain-containing protein [Paenibacillus allorhizosphaerae]|uniref:SLH domain-containing protein n=1 Tax=Paenibacillus allorhizosphaerae TaxID=2849866 RepID=A0ABN7TQ70_9BACL|nr:S-layer homology domain-containing protein [Paenibacillus allorhizosphaerae]CAG7646102.1 hypothetical protein PAECIP111802_03659 [Paenibacillus allorhizosphaerae]